MVVRTATIAMATLLSGCASLDVAVNRGAEANDAAVSASIFCLCNGCSVGSVRRYFREDPALWTDLCLDNFEFTLEE